MMAHKAELWVLEFLLDQDALSETVVRELYEHLLVAGGDQSKTIQVRLLLRVLREHAANISDATLNALNCLAVNSTEGGGDYSPYATLRQLVPSIELYLQVKTELVLQCLRAGPLEAVLQTDAPRQQLEKYFPTTDHPQPGDEQRKEELAIGFTSPASAQALLDKYRSVDVEHNMLKYVVEGRAAMGPSFLKVVENHTQNGMYHPYHQDVAGMMAESAGFAYGDPNRKRARGSMAEDAAAAATITNLQQAAGGQGGFAAALHGDGGVGPSNMGGEGMQWHTPDQMGTPQDGMGRGGSEMALVGPNGEPLTGEGPKSPRNKSGAKRRRNGRWSQEETNTLIGLVRQWGKGKWKKILEEGGPSFKNRSQVDLKDKWRNLERQGVVGPADSAQPAGTPGGGENGGVPGDNQLMVVPGEGGQQAALAQHGEHAGVHMEALPPPEQGMAHQALSHDSMQHALTSVQMMGGVPDGMHVQ